MIGQAEARLTNKAPVAGTVFVTAALIPIVVAWATAGLERYTFLGLAAATLCLGSSMIVTPEAWWLSPSFWFTIAWLVFFVARPLYDLSIDDVAYNQGIPIGQTYPTAVFLGALGMFGFWLGTLSIMRFARRSPKWRVGATDASHSLSLDRFRRAFRFLLLLVTGLYALFLLQNGGLGTFATFLSGRSDATSAAYANSSGYLYTAPLWLFPVGLYLTVRRDRIYPRWVGPLLIAGSLIANIGVGDRSYILPVVASTYLAVCERGRRAPRILTIALLIPVVVVFGIVYPREARAAHASGSPMSPLEITLTSLRHPAEALLSGDDTSAARTFALTVGGVPSQVPYQYGETYLSLLARPIPRELFPHGKPRSGDAIVGDLVQHDQTGIQAGFSTSIFAEPYIDFGAPGVFIISFILALAWQAAFMRFLRLRESPAVYTLWCASVPVLAVWVRGGISIDFQRLAYFTLPLVAVLAYSRIAPVSASKKGRLGEGRHLVEPQ